MYIKSRRKLVRAAAAVTVAVVLLTCAPVRTLADDLAGLQQQQKSLQQQQQTLQNQLNSQNSQISSAKNQLSTLQSSISVLTRQMANLNSQISVLNQQIDAKNQDIATTQANIDSTYTLYKQQVRAMYEAGNASYLNVLLSAKDFTDFIQRAEVLRVVADHNNKVIDSLTQAKAKLDADKASLSASQASLQSAKNDLAAKQSQVSGQISQQNQVIKNLNNGADMTLQQQQQIDAQLDAITAQIVAAQRGPAGSSSDLVNFARKFTGVPYDFGNPGTDAFDCSSFTAYVYANVAHKALDHFTLSQYLYSGGTRIPASDHNLLPGDLVFFETTHQDGTYYNGHWYSHVGIYTGNGNFIAANSSGVGEGPLFTSSYWGPKYLGAVRIPF